MTARVTLRSLVDKSNITLPGGQILGPGEQVEIELDLTAPGAVVTAINTLITQRRLAVVTQGNDEINYARKVSVVNPTGADAPRNRVRVLGGAQHYCRVGAHKGAFAVSRYPGGGGALGDYIDKVIANVTVSANSRVLLRDASSAMLDILALNSGCTSTYLTGILSAANSFTGDQLFGSHLTYQYGYVSGTGSNVVPRWKLARRIVNSSWTSNITSLGLITEDMTPQGVGTVVKTGGTLTISSGTTITTTSISDVTGVQVGMAVANTGGTGVVPAYATITGISYSAPTWTLTVGAGGMTAGTTGTVTFSWPFTPYFSATTSGSTSGTTMTFTTNISAIGAVHVGMGVYYPSNPTYTSGIVVTNVGSNTITLSAAPSSAVPTSSTIILSSVAIPRVYNLLEVLPLNASQGTHVIDLGIESMNSGWAVYTENGVSLVATGHLS